MLLPTTMNLTCSLLCLDPPLPSADIDIDAFDYDCSRSTSPSYASSDDDSDDEDEDEHNVRVAPHWEAYRHLFESHGYHLDTCKDVRQFYLRYWETRNIQQSIQSCAGYNSACREDRDDNELCKDEGLVSRSPSLLLLSLSVDSRSIGLLPMINRSYILSGLRQWETDYNSISGVCSPRSQSACFGVNAWRTTSQS